METVEAKERLQPAQSLFVRYQCSCRDAGLLACYAKFYLFAGIARNQPAGFSGLSGCKRGIQHTAALSETMA